MAAPRKKSSRPFAPEHQRLDLWTWFKQSHILVQLGLGACAALITYAGAVRAFHELGWEKKLPASVEYVDGSIEVAQGKLQAPLLDIQENLARNRLKDLEAKILAADVAMANEGNPGKRAVIANERSKLVKDRDEQEAIITGIAGKRK